MLIKNPVQIPAREKKRGQFISLSGNMIRLSLSVFMYIYSGSKKATHPLKWQAFVM